MTHKPAKRKDMLTRSRGLEGDRKRREKEVRGER